MVNFDLPPRARLQPEPTCARPRVFAGGAGVGLPVGTQVGTPGGHASISTRDGALGLLLGSHVGKQDGQATTGSRSAALGLPVGVSMGTQARPASTTGTAATAPIPRRDTGGRTRARQGKRKSPPPDGVVGPPPPPKLNFGMLPSPQRQMSAPTEGLDPRQGPPMAEIVRL